MPLEGKGAVGGGCTATALLAVLQGQKHSSSNIGPLTHKYTRARLSKSSFTFPPTQPPHNQLLKIPS
jgi:hypothetical protein